MTKNSKAYDSGFSDGADRVQQASINGERTDRASLQEWFAPGQEEADAGLINALGLPGTAEELGVDSTDGAEWDAALADYNAGFRAGVLSEVTK
jgi:hypothetical protein